jgi:hypothetical protein
MLLHFILQLSMTDTHRVSCSLRRRYTPSRREHEALERERERESHNKSSSTSEYEDKRIDTSDICSTASEHLTGKPPTMHI